MKIFAVEEFPLVLMLYNVESTTPQRVQNLMCKRQKYVVGKKWDSQEK